MKRIAIVGIVALMALLVLPSQEASAGDSMTHHLCSGGHGWNANATAVVSYDTDCQWASVQHRCNYSWDSIYHYEAVATDYTTNCGAYTYGWLASAHGYRSHQHSL